MLFLSCQELKRFPSLQAELAAASTEALEKFRDDGRKTALRLVDMESSYLTVDFFRRLPQELDKAGNISTPATDRYTEAHLRRIGMAVMMHFFTHTTFLFWVVLKNLCPFLGSNVSAYVGMVCETLKNSIPKAVVHCQVQEAKRSLLNHFYTQIGKREVIF